MRTPKERYARAVHKDGDWRPEDQNGESAAQQKAAPAEDNRGPVAPPLLASLPFHSEGISSSSNPRRRLNFFYWQKENLQKKLNSTLNWKGSYMNLF